MRRVTYDADHVGQNPCIEFTASAGSDLGAVARAGDSSSGQFTLRGP